MVLMIFFFFFTIGWENNPDFQRLCSENKTVHGVVGDTGKSLVYLIS